jgi:hypothetical protein
MSEFQPYDQGNDAVGWGTKPAPRPNARLYFPWSSGSGPHIELWVTDVTVDFGLSGTTAQSAKQRSFFARNSIPPAFTVACQAPNQYIYGQTQEFFRSSQRGFSDLAYLHIKAGGIKANNSTKGVHQNIGVEGYVQATRRRHERFVNAPAFTFGFVTAFMHAPFTDTIYAPQAILTWKDVVEKIRANDPNAGFAVNPDARPVTPTADRDFDVPDVPPQTPGPNGELRPN